MCVCVCLCERAGASDIPLGEDDYVVVFCPPERVPNGEARAALATPCLHARGNAAVCWLSRSLLLAAHCRRAV